MKLPSAWLMTALPAAEVAFAGGARDPRVSAQFRADMADALPTGDPVHAPRASPVSFDATEAAPPAEAAPGPAFRGPRTKAPAAMIDRTNSPSLGVRRRQ